jgi:hemerythrin-like domain-containing protein
LLKDHIKKEDLQLFKIADDSLSDNTKQIIQEKFDLLEKEVIGQGKHEQYHSWLNMLKEAYL